MQAKKDEECGNDELAKKKRRGVLALNITAIVCFVVLITIVFIVPIAVLVPLLTIGTTTRVRY